MFLIITWQQISHWDASGKKSTLKNQHSEIKSNLRRLPLQGTTGLRRKKIKSTFEDNHLIEL